MIFNIYKREQGKYTRLWSAFGVAVIVSLGCLQLYKRLDATDLSLWVETMVPAGLFVAFAVLIFWLLNKPVVADFLISAESEIKKVNWSSKKEIAASTLIVIIMVTIVALLLGVTDLSFKLFFMWLLG